jgi:hypothetical protein
MDPKVEVTLLLNAPQYPKEHCFKLFQVSPACPSEKSRESSPFTGLDRPRGFQEVKAPRFRDSGTEWW